MLFIGRANLMQSNLTCPGCQHHFVYRFPDKQSSVKCPLCGRSVLRPDEPDSEPIIELSAATNRVCESCGAPMDAKAVLCIECGFNHSTGAQVSRKSKKKKNPLTEMILTDKSYSIHRTWFGKTFWVQDASGRTIFELTKSRSWLLSRRYDIRWRDAETDKPVLDIERTESGWLKRAFEFEQNGKELGSLRFSRNLLKEPFNIIMRWNNSVVVDMVHREQKQYMSCAQVALFPFIVVLMPLLVQIFAIGIVLLFLLSPLIIVILLSGLIPIPVCHFRFEDDDKPTVTLKSSGIMRYDLIRTSSKDKRNLLIPLILSIIHLQRDLRVGEVVIQASADRHSREID
jgi:hypothetical protein